MIRNLLFACVAAAVTLTVGCATQPAPGAIEAPGGDSAVLTILHTNDVHGRVHLPGEAQGLSKIGTLVRETREAMPHVLLLDGGDIIHGTPEEKAFEGRPVLAAMNALEYDAAVAGNHEFDFGKRVARNAFDYARFPMLTANILDVATGEPWAGLEPYIVREFGDVRVAIFGLTTPGTPAIQWPRTLEGIRFADPVETARALVPHLRSTERADVVIALTHLGVTADRALAAAVDGIDVIVGGHSHTRLDDQVWLGNTLIAQSGAHARALGRIDLLVQRAGDGYRVTGANGRSGDWWGYESIPAPHGLSFPDAPILELSSDIADDPIVVAAYRPFAEEIRPRLERVLTTASEPLPAARTKDEPTRLGEILADAVRASTGADVAFAAASQISPRGLPAGPVRVRDLYGLLGAYTRQHLVVVRTPGVHLRRVLGEAGVPGPSALHVSGASPAGAEFQVGGETLRDDASYVVAAAAHIIQDALLGRQGVEVLRDDPEDATLRDAAIEYFGTLPVIHLNTPRLD